MNRTGITLGCWGLIGGFLLLVPSADAQPDKDGNLKEIMTRLHQGKDCVRANIDRGFRADNPDWGSVQKLTREYLDGAEATAKKKPGKGDDASWNQFTREYISLARELDQAAANKDKKKGQDIHAKLVSRCSDCHTAHRVKDK